MTETRFAKMRGPARSFLIGLATFAVTAVAIASQPTTAALIFA
ncbi:hypothetical protein [Sphingomonas japonica]|uniref:Uncharacterized protein n=1 Tax=Sphingomonas japonica TaxID=511662 RepID=A0ABX0TWL6_9SPHN|nr:hypothetical protein [Sphingomonas japonica]NIJ22633.1 hypothetical protein [Sphingomonas japonica]